MKKFLNTGTIEFIAIIASILSLVLIATLPVYYAKKELLPFQLVYSKQGNLTSIEQVAEWQACSTPEQRLEFAERYGVDPIEVQEVEENYNFISFLLELN